MKLDGQLERAQLENLANATPTPTPLGRIYADISNPASAVPRFHNGTAWVPVLTGQATALVSQNSGTACTVDWSTGLNQQVILTGHATISFANPQSGLVHTLMVTQRATDAASTTPYMYKFNMADQLTRRMGYQPVGVLQSSETQVHNWFYDAGIKPAYATIPASYGNPGALPSTLITGIDIHPSLNVVGAGRTSSPFTQTLRFSDGGAKWYWGKLDPAVPTTAAAQAVAFKYHPDGHSAFIASGTTPFIQGFLVDGNGVPNAATYANPGTLPTGAAQCIAIHPSGSHVAVGHTTTPFLSVYPINSDAYGTKLTNPVSLPAAQVNSCAFAPTGDYLAVAGQTSPFLEIYPFDPFTGFGAKLANPGTLPAGGPPGALGQGVAWHPSGNYVAVAMNSSPYVRVYAFNRAAGTIGANTDPAATGAPAATCNCVRFSPCGNFLLAGNTAGMFIWDFTTFGASGVLTFDGANTGQQVNDFVFHHSGEIIIAALNASPFIMAYPMPRKVKNYVKLVL